MKNFLKYGLILLVLFIFGTWIYIESHQPQLRGNLKLKSVEQSVDVYFDSFGVPHIYAQNSRDAYRALGYVHAQDRLFQMELMRRVGAGRLSEIFGAELLEADMFFRTLGVNRKAKSDAEAFASASMQVKDAANAYLEGVNEYIENGKLPIEFKILRLKEETYTIEDMYLISGYMAYSFAYALRTDPVMEKINNKWGHEYLRQIGVEMYRDTTQRVDTSSADQMAFSISELLDEKLPVPVFQGSNSWVVGPERSLSGKVLLANDPHIKYASPSVWYEAHMEYPGFSFYGNHLAGIPVPLTGHSRNHAWGLTMFEDDDSDFYYETWASSDSSSTVYKDSLTAPVRQRPETISFDGRDTTFIVYETVHGPLINQFLPVPSDKPVSMEWNYLKHPNELLTAFYQMSHASNLTDFQKGVMRIASPGLNITYGDAAGNIAGWSASKLVKRPKHINGKTYRDGSEAKDENLGYYPFARNPHELNPERGYIVSANQKHDSLEGVIYPGYYAPDNRFDRISNLLEAMNPATPDSMASLLNDNTSDVERDVARTIVMAMLEGNMVPSDFEQKGIDILLEWSGSHDVDQIAPTIYYKVLHYCLREAMEDEMGFDAFDEFLKSHAMKKAYPILFKNDSSFWWNNVLTTDQLETRSLIFRKAFQKGMSELQAELGTDIESWTWGRVHTLKHGHPLGKVDLLSQWFDVGPFPAPGGNETINNAGFIYNGDGEYPITYGPSMRTVIDFADVSHSVTILPTGNSGNVMSPHYKDQAEKYVHGKFREMKMDETEIKKSTNILHIIPAK